MSFKDCCIKVKNCSGLLKGMSESQVQLIEDAGENLSPELEREINDYWDKTIKKGKKLEKKLKDAE